MISAWCCSSPRALLETPSSRPCPRPLGQALAPGEAGAAGEELWLQIIRRHCRIFPSPTSSASAAFCRCPPRLLAGVDPPNKGPSLQPEALAQSQGCSLPPLKLHARWVFARSPLGTSRVTALRSQRCTFGKGQQVSGSALPVLCPPPSYSLHEDEPPFPFGSRHPPRCFCEMQSPSSDVAYFMDFAVFPLVF